MHLLFHSGFLPTTGPEHHLLGLAEDVAPFLRERVRRPHKAEVSFKQVLMVRVVDASGITEDLAAYPLMHFIGRY